MVVAALEPMVPVVMAILLVPALRALSMFESVASMASTMPLLIPPEFVIRIALSTMVEPVPEVSALSRKRRASVFKSPVVLVEAALTRLNR